jgi:glycosyltransferase involved in cell wall biosynthesis
VTLPAPTEVARAGERQVPAYSVREFAPRRQRYCVAVFVINENGRLLAQLDRMKAQAGAVDVVVADGGSSDGSTEEANLAPRGVRTLLVKTGPGKLSAQMRMAFDYALAQGYEGIVTMDGNDKDDPAAIGRFVEALDRGVHHVQGSRFVPGGEAVNTPWMRLLGIRLLHAPLIRFASGFHYTDTTNGFRAYSRRLLDDPRVAPFRDVFSRYELHYYLAIRSARLGYAVQEVPVRRAYPAKGKTPTKISPIRGSLLVLSTLLRACLHRFDPPATPSRSGK